MGDRFSERSGGARLAVDLDVDLTSSTPRPPAGVGLAARAPAARSPRRPVPVPCWQRSRLPPESGVDDNSDEQDHRDNADDEIAGGTAWDQSKARCQLVRRPRCGRDHVVPPLGRVPATAVAAREKPVDVRGPAPRTCSLRGPVGLLMAAPLRFPGGGVISPLRQTGVVRERVGRRARCEVREATLRRLRNDFAAQRHRKEGEPTTPAEPSHVRRATAAAASSGVVRTASRAALTSPLVRRFVPCGGHSMLAQ